MKENSQRAVQNIEGLKEQNNSKSLLGFRTNKTWKKIITISYLILCVAFAVFAIFEGRKGQITSYDYLINKISNIVLVFCSFCPYIFLSNTKFRDKLPLFKKHSIGASIGGLSIVFIALFIIYGVVNYAHSSEYKADMKNHAYIQVSSKDATCETDGEIEYYCEYCEKTNTEIIAKLGHSMVEVTRKEATENEDGQIVNKCSTCGKQETITLDKLTQKDTTTKESTETVTEETTQLITTQATEPITEFKWKSAIGNLYNGVELYIVTEGKSFLYGVVTEYDTSAHQVQVYLVEGDNYMWFPTREVSFLTKLKVRSDDPYLPENMINN